MEFLTLFILLLLIFSLLLMIAGIIKPTYAVWWEDIQNRKRVFKIYGWIILGLGIIYIILKMI